MHNRPKSLPAYRLHKFSGQAIVTLPDHNGKRRDVLLGEYGSSASRQEYARAIGEWEAAGRRAPRRAVHGLTVAELLRDFLRFAQGHYKPNEQGHCSEVEALKRAFKVTRELFAAEPAADFGPKALKDVRAAMIAIGWCRKYVNHQINRLRRVFKWGVEEELLPASAYHALQAVAALRAGAPGVRESRAVKAVAIGTVEECLPFMPPIVAAMVRLQLLTGMRPGEVCIMRSGDIEMSGRVWRYIPQRHKTEHHDKGREVFIGPKAQEVLRPWLRTDLAAYLFSPLEAEAARNAKRRESRQTPLWPAHIEQQQKNRKRNPKRSKRSRYDVDSYRRAIANACDRAFPPAAPLAKLKGESREAWRARLTDEQREALSAWRRAHRWHPHQLRHTAATTIRKEHGIELARIILGHSTAFTTEIYAEADRMQALDVMARIG
jgi:integrase